MSERDYLLAAIERCGKRAKIAKGNLDRFTLMPGDAFQREDLSQAERRLA